jgi:3-oxoisoapionate decarboxylase
MNIFMLLDKAATYGLHLVQICDNLSYYGMGHSELEAIYEYAANLDIILGLGTRGVSPAHLLKVLEYARPLHAETLRTVIDNPDPHQVINGLKTVVPELEKANLILILENTEILDAREIALIIKTVDSPFVQVCMDTANSLGRVQPLEQVVEALRPYIRMIHYKDYTVQRVSQAPPVVRMGFEIVGRPAGEGQVDINWLLRSAVNPANPPDIVLELWPPYLDTISKTVQNELDWVDRSIAFLKAHVVEGKNA